MVLILRLIIAFNGLTLAPAHAQEGPAMAAHRMQEDIAESIQARILTPILGERRSSAFIRFDLQVSLAEELSSRRGNGSAIRRARSLQYSSSAEEDVDIFSGFGFDEETPRPIRLPSGERSGAHGNLREQKSDQVKGTDERRTTWTIRRNNLRMVVLHAPDIPAESLRMARQALLLAFKGELHAGNLSFHPLLPALSRSGI